MVEPATGAILAGGKSRRMGTDKCFIRDPSGASVVESIIAKFDRIFPEVLVIANDAEPYERLGVTIQRDVIPDSGSLGGIYTALASAKYGRCFVVACDMPFLNEALIRHMVELPVSYDALVPRLNGETEPIHAIYRKTCIPAIERVLQAGGRRIVDFFDEVKVQYLPREEILALDPEGLSFFNINTPEDLDRAKAIWAAGQP